MSLTFYSTKKILEEKTIQVLKRKLISSPFFDDNSLDQLNFNKPTKVTQPSQNVSISFHHLERLNNVRYASLISSLGI